jgi:hypothetical protein
LTIINRQINLQAIKVLLEVSSGSTLDSVRINPKGNRMNWILKGLSLGTLTFVAMSILFVVVKLISSEAKSAGMMTIYAWTVHNPFYWLAFILVLSASCLMFKVISAPSK